MTLGKSKKFVKKLNKRKKVDPFLKKTWVSLVAPAVFQNRLTAQTAVNQAYGKFQPTKSLTGRVLELNLADLSPSLSEKTSPADRVIRLKLQSVSPNATEARLVFDGYRCTTHARKSLVSSGKCLVETFVQVELADGLSLRAKIICFTARAHVKRKHVRRIRSKLKELLGASLQTLKTNEFVQCLTDGSMETTLEKECCKEYFVKTLIVEKVKVVGRNEYNLAHTLDEQHEMTQTEKTN